MTGVKMAIAAGALIAAGGVGAAFAPAARTEAQAVAIRQGRGDRDVRIVASRGGRIGVTVSEVGDEAVKENKLPAPGGVRIDDVEDDSPAATAGLEAGDVVVEFDGERVRGTRQFVRLVQETPAGRSVQAVVMRNGQRTPVTITPRDNGFQYFGGDIDQLIDGARAWAMPVPPAPPVAPAPPAAAPPAPAAPPLPPERFFEFDDLFGRGAGRLGLRVAALEPQLAEYFGTKQGVLVTSVDSDSPAAKAGVKAGDVVLSLNAQAVSSPAELRREAQRLEPNTGFTLEIVRDKKTTTVKGTTDDAPRRRTRTTV